jgi:hypothetical protein
MDAEVLPRLATAFLGRIKAECMSRIERTTVALYAVQHDQVKRDRTGVLYNVAGHHFILTASHHLRSIVQAGIPLYIDLVDGSSSPIPITDAVFLSTEEDGRDVAAIKLSGEVIEQLRPHKDFLTHADVRLNDRNQDALYLIFGYPEVWSRVVGEHAVASYGMAYSCRPFQGERSPDAFFHQDVHILLEFDQQALSVIDQATHQLPRPHGISGCGIWRVVGLSKEAIRQWRPGHVCLVALQHTWFPQRKYIQGTWVGYALALIQEKYPDVSAAMELAYPVV